MNDTSQMQHTRPEWTDDQVRSLDAWQMNDNVHPFTCPHREHHDNDGRLMPTNDGWVCMIPRNDQDQAPCDYTQNWAHDFMFIPEAFTLPVRIVLTSLTIAAADLELLQWSEIPAVADYAQKELQEPGSGGNILLDFVQKALDNQT